MSLTIGLLLTLSFVVSLIALAFLIWAVATRQMAFDQRSASTIFVEGEEGHPDDAGVALNQTSACRIISIRRAPESI